MKIPRISIGGLMTVVAVVAGLTAVARGQDGWIDVCRFVTVGVLVVATFRARERTGSQGAFWFGFAVLGWAVFGLTVNAVSYRSINSALNLMAWEVTGWVVEVTPNSFEAAQQAIQHAQVVHLGFTLIAGLAGGVFSWWRESRPRRMEPR